MFYFILFQHFTLLHQQLFKEIEIYFSLEGERWQEDFISMEPKQDRVSEHARIIHVDLENRTAKHVMMKLYFQHEWILISEVTFKSGKIFLNPMDSQIAISDDSQQKLLLSTNLNR